MTVKSRVTPSRVLPLLGTLLAATACVAQGIQPSIFARVQSILPSPGATYECHPNAGGGKRKCDHIPVIVYEGTPSSSSYANCLVLLPYDTLKIHTNGAGSAGTKVTFELDSPDNNRFNLTNLVFTPSTPSQYTVNVIAGGAKLSLTLANGIASSPTAGYAHTATVVDTQNGSKPCQAIDPVVINVD